jgi:hypothetical protein
MIPVEIDSFLHRKFKKAAGRPEAVEISRDWQRDGISKLILRCLGSRKSLETFAVANDIYQYRRIQDGGRSTDSNFISGYILPVYRLPS